MRIRRTSSPKTCGMIYCFRRSALAQRETRLSTIIGVELGAMDLLQRVEALLALKVDSSDAEIKPALENYTLQIQKYADQLDQYIEKHASQSINATQCFYWFSFDVMGHFAFSRSFDLLQNERWDETIESLHSGMSLMGPLSPVPWLVRVIFSFSFLPDVRKWNRMNRWIAERLDERLEVGSSRFKQYAFTLLTEMGLENGERTRRKKCSKQNKTACNSTGLHASRFRTTLSSGPRTTTALPQICIS